MKSREVTITNETGFHIRPAQLFTEKAASFSSTIHLQPAGTENKIDGKSILGLMTLGLTKGSVVSIIADGSDEEDAVKALSELVESGFGEA